MMMMMMIVQFLQSQMISDKQHVSTKKSHLHDSDIRFVKVVIGNDMNYKYMIHCDYMDAEFLSNVCVCVCVCVNNDIKRTQSECSMLSNFLLYSSAQPITFSCAGLVSSACIKT
jgi:hypothetical protein